MGRATNADIECDDDLRLTPVSTIHQKQILDGINVSGNEAFQAMPWLEINEPITNQLDEYIRDVQNMERRFIVSLGRMFTWKICGLIALDYTPN